MTDTCKRGHPRTPENTSASGKCLVCHRERQREKLQDEEYRKRVQERKRQRYHANQAIRERALQNMRKRRERIAADPQLKEHELEMRRFQAEAMRRRKGVPMRNWLPGSSKRGPDREKHSDLGVVSPVPFLAWLERYLALSDDTLDGLAMRAGSSAHTVRDLRRGARSAVQLITVAAFLDAAGDSAMLHELYPPDGSEGVVPELPRRAPRPVVCGFRDCREPRGHGAFGLFCPEHGALLDRIRESFEQDGKQGKLGRMAAARERRWARDYADDELEGVAA